MASSIASQMVSFDSRLATIFCCSRRGEIEISNSTALFIVILMDIIDPNLSTIVEIYEAY